MIRPLLASAAMLTLAACSTASYERMPQTANLPTSAEDALAYYYERLAREVTLPVAPPNVSLASSTAITRLAFGSCNNENRSQHMWAQIAATDPQAFLFIGDNVYGDTGWDGDAGLATLRASYAKQASHPEFASFRAAVPMLTSWDDHDYGFNDGGGDFAFKRWAETIYETYWGVPQEVKARPGVYESRTVGPQGQRTQIILLDTRYFRSDLDRMPYTPERPPLGPYVPTGNVDATMLGDAQWAWLQQELAKPADLRVVVSSIQVITDAHNYESWENMPAERARLFDMLSERAGGGVVMLTGDRHAGGIYTAQRNGETFWELTSSSLNYSFSSTERNTAREPDPTRVTDFISEENFGLVDVDWDAKTYTMRLLGNQGETRVERTVGFAG